MFLLQREVPNDPSSLAYFMGCASQGKSIAVDVHLEDVAWFMQQATQKGVDITYIIDTHIHADHASGAKELARLTGAKHILHRCATPKFDFTPVEHGQKLQAGNVEVEILHTPGHTLDSICLLVTDHSRGADPWFLISQHILFVGSVGRPDLRGQERVMAGYLYDSIHSKILTLPDYIELLPGAKAGSVCGVGLSAKASSTIGYEKAHNALLKLNKDEFIEQVLQNLPPFPENMDTMIQANIA